MKLLVQKTEPADGFQPPEFWTFDKFLSFVESFTEWVDFRIQKDYKGRRYVALAEAVTHSAAMMPKLYIWGLYDEDMQPVQDTEVLERVP